MSVGDWYGKREILLTGLTSELGRALLEKLLRALPNVKINAIVRSRNALNKDDRIKKIFASAGFERLRQEDPKAIHRVKGLEGNLLYENLGLSEEDKESLKNVEVVLHAGGPQAEVLAFCQQLPCLRAVVAASSLFKENGKIGETTLNEKIPDIPLTIVRIPIVGPAYKEPMPGYVDTLRGATTLMIGAGYALGKSDLSAEVLPVDLAANALIVAAWDRGRKSRSDEPLVYNAPNLGCSWGVLVEKGSLANRKFSYPTFGIRGMTSVVFLHWIVVFFLEWMPSTVCDTILSVFGVKPRFVAEHEKIRTALRSLEPIALRSWPVQRNRIHQLQECLTPEDRETYPICSEIDIETYVLCAAASVRKNCVDEVNLKIVKSFKLFLSAVIVLTTLYCLLK